MKVRLIKSAYLQVPAGMKIDLPDSRARLLIKAGIAISAEPQKAQVVEAAVKEPEEVAEAKPAQKKKSKKKE